MSRNSVKRPETHSLTTKRLLILAQILSLIAYAMGLQFLKHTTGGTLFVFATIAPVLVGIVVLSLIGVMIYEFRRRHSLFDFETYAPGHVIFRQGDEGDRAYFIHSGEVEVIREENGAEDVVAKLTKGHYFGEMALISNAPRNATVRALTEARVAVLGKKNFLTLLSVMPSTQEDIMKRVSERAMEQTAQ
jgi:cyclic nucleotide-binding protein